MVIYKIRYEKMKLHKIILSIVTCCFYICTAFAQEVPEILPDDPVYLAKRHIETARLNAAVDPLEKADLHTEFAKERLAEINSMVAKGKPEFVGDLARDYENAMTGATNEINRAQSQGKNVSEALRAVERSTSKHTEVLTNLLDKVPEDAKPAILRSIAVSRQGRNTALDNLRKVQRDEISGGRSERSDRSQRTSRTRDMNRQGDLQRSRGGRSSGGGDKPAGRGR